MSVKRELQQALENEEKRTVSDSFGASPVKGRTPSFSVPKVAAIVRTAAAADPTDDVSQYISGLAGKMRRVELQYVLASAIRFSFLIELTNLKITSTKFKTRWLPGQITKTRPGTFTNYAGPFEPGSDPRASTYDDCYGVFHFVLGQLSGSADHLDVVRKLAKSGNRRVSYEFVFTHIDIGPDPMHIASNVRLVSLADISWLLGARELIRPALPTASGNKIKAKTYLTDRSQTGTDQTNRAKRWEILSTDFQFAMLEQCWSVERKLLSDLVHFRGFPENIKLGLVQRELFAERTESTRCPIMLTELEYEDFVKGATHGKSQFQVGHLKPLKAGGAHTGENVAWITSDGNRIQGDLELDEVRDLLKVIVERMAKLTDEGSE